MSSKILEYIGNNFLFKKLKEVTRRTDILALILTNREELVADLKTEGNLGERWINYMSLRKGSNESFRIRTMNLKKPTLTNSENWQIRSHRRKI